MTIKKFIAVAGLLATLFAMQAAHAIVIDFAPPGPYSVIAGDVLEVDVVVSGLDAAGEIVSAFDLDILFDDSMLSASSVVFGSELGDIGAFEALAFAGLLGPGVLDIAEVSLLTDAALDALQSDTVLLATLFFDVLTTGDTSLAFEFGPGNDVKGRNNQVIIPTAMPEPGTLLLFAAGLLGVVLARRRIV